MARTVLLVPAEWDGVLPAQAVPVLRGADPVLADATVPDDTAKAVGAQRGEPSGADWVLLTTDPAHPAVHDADEVVAAPRPPGGALLDAVAVMDRLRSPGGCPWDAEQTHRSLLPYLVEECYELYQAIEDGDDAAIREELGDVLLQVLFHARVAAEDVEPVPDGAKVALGAVDAPKATFASRHGVDGGPGQPFDIDDVAADLVAKLVGRHPHVFAGTERIETAERQEHRWEELKRSEKQRESSVDGVAIGQPAVALAAKLTSRTARAGLPAELLPDGAGVGEQLFALAARARLEGLDPEDALRTTARRFADDVRAAEDSARAAGHDPQALDADAWRAHWPASADQQPATD